MVDNIEALVPDPENARRHTERSIAMIEESMREVGPARSILIDEHNVILAGNASTEAARRAGVSNVRVVESDGTKLVVVRVTGLTPEQKKKLALADNRAGELAEWDVVKVKALFDAGVPITDFWSGHELAAMFHVGAPPEADDSLKLAGIAETGVPTLYFGEWALRMGQRDEDRLRAVLEAVRGDDVALAAIGEGMTRC